MRAALLLVLSSACASPVAPSEPVTPRAPSAVERAPEPAPTADPEPAPTHQEPPARVAPPEPAPRPRDPNAPSTVSAIPDTALVSASGLGFEVLHAGPGTTASPRPVDTVSVRYHGWTADGVKFVEESDPRGASFKLSTVGAGWQEALRMMRPGDRARLWVPHDLAPSWANEEGLLVYDIELVSITRAQAIPADVGAPPKKAKKTKGGVSYIVLTRGKGKTRPAVNDKVEVHYAGWTTDGKMFDSSYKRGRPATFRPNQVIPGWTEALQLMRVGSKWRVWIPEELAYKGRAGAPQGMLVFDIEVLSIEAMPRPPKTPRDVKRPPRRAKRTASGVRWRYLKRGPRKGAKPQPEDTVEVHYSGWTTDGKMFDSSITRGRSASFPLSGVIEGWRDGLRVMRVGDTVRMWIPEKLAYEGKPGRPQGMLVFDVELLDIKSP